MNLNTADVELLQRLPRIGPALAGRIIAYRQNRGPFTSINQVVNVRGIGEKTLEKMAPWIYVE
jgi:competence protein ComEA